MADTGAHKFYFSTTWVLKNEKRKTSEGHENWQLGYLTLDFSHVSYMQKRSSCFLQAILKV